MNESTTLQWCFYPSIATVLRSARRHFPDYLIVRPPRRRLIDGALGFCYPHKSTAAPLHDRVTWSGSRVTRTV